MAENISENKRKEEIDVRVKNELNEYRAKKKNDVNKTQTVSRNYILFGTVIFILGSLPLLYISLEQDKEFSFFLYYVFAFLTANYAYFLILDRSKKRSGLILGVIIPIVVGIAIAIISELYNMGVLIK